MALKLLQKKDGSYDLFVDWGRYTRVLSLTEEEAADLMKQLSTYIPRPSDQETA